MNELTSPRQQLLTRTIADYRLRTAESRKIAEQYRGVLADKSAIGFKTSEATRGIAYPIAACKAEGAYLWDADGNRYVDILMGLGLNLFGHNPEFARLAIAEQLQRGYPLGPQSPLAGEVAVLLAELTGMERFCFSNTGTEAVMTALKLARTATGRDHIAIFAQSYHGHADAMLMRAPLAEYARKKLLGRLRGNSFARPLAALLERTTSTAAVPAFPGISKAAAREVIVLDYGNPHSLDIIKKHQHRLAAVLVEPIQSRQPELQPGEFLRALRELTTQTDIALIFDEMVTGFRLAAGGAQAHFGIRADLATYSKIVGGGLPFSVIAGSARFMNHIDGGVARYAESESIDVPTTFFAGTFVKHPLALAAAKATLERLRAEGPGLYDKLNTRCTLLVDRLNVALAEHGLPVEFTRMGSFFAVNGSRSRWSDEAQLLLSYLLLNRGIHLRIGDRGGFLSTAHSDADVDTIYQAFVGGFEALRAADFFY
jgi:glutamate-1-semialdehyde 2,1-aminomutase